MVTTTFSDAPGEPIAGPLGLTGVGPLVVAGVASLGAGAVHAVAVGSHAAEPQAARAFALLAVLQVGWGAFAVVGRHRMVAAAALAINSAALVGWVLAKTRGIPGIEGLGQAEGIQRADALAAALAALAVVVALRFLVSGSRHRIPSRPVLGVAAVALSTVSLVAMDGAGTHSHAGGSGHAPGEAELAAGSDGAADHAHTGSEAEGAEATAGHAHGGTEAEATGSEAADGHPRDATPAVATTPYDPAKPIDLRGGWGDARAAGPSREPGGDHPGPAATLRRPGGGRSRGLPHHPRRRHRPRALHQLVLP